MEEKKPHDPQMVAAAATSPAFGSATASAGFLNSAVRGLGGTDFTEHWRKIREACIDVTEGKMLKPEAMLMAQAMTLESVFNRCIELAGVNMTRDLQQGETLLRMALKAQSQCSQTLRVLGELKHPRQVAFIHQQNNAAGHQQVNNDTQPPPACAREEAEISANELLEKSHGERLDPGAAGQAGRGDQTLEAVGAVVGAKDRPGQE